MEARFPMKSSAKNFLEKYSMGFNYTNQITTIEKNDNDLIPSIFFAKPLNQKDCM